MKETKEEWTEGNEEKQLISNERKTKEEIDKMNYETQRRKKEKYLGKMNRKMDALDPNK